MMKPYRIIIHSVQKHDSIMIYCCQKYQNINWFWIFLMVSILTLCSIDTPVLFVFFLLSLRQWTVEPIHAGKMTLYAVVLNIQYSSLVLYISFNKYKPFMPSILCHCFSHGIEYHNSIIVGPFRIMLTVTWLWIVPFKCMHLCLHHVCIYSKFSSHCLVK